MGVREGIKCSRLRGGAPPGRSPGRVKDYGSEAKTVETSKGANENGVGPASSLKAEPSFAASEGATASAW